MDDRELLEWAAKAAGIDYETEKSKPHPVSGCWWGFWLVYHREPNDSDRRYWNPLTDDGDCARLEATLAISVQWFDDFVLCAALGNGVIKQENYNDHNNDRAKARRCASVRAAAAIGKYRQINVSAA